MKRPRACTASTAVEVYSCTKVSIGAGYHMPGIPIDENTIVIDTISVFGTRYSVYTSKLSFGVNIIMNAGRPGGGGPKDVRL